MTEAPNASELGAAPLEVYRGRLAARTEAVRGLKRRASLVSHARLWVFVAAVVAAFLVFGSGSLPGVVLAALVAGFLVLVFWHDRLLQDQGGFERAMAFYERGVARVGAGWTELPAPTLPVPPDHPYCEDLDCLGVGSLLHRISEARTREGQARLGAWLLEAAPIDEIRARQAAIAELSSELSLRESIARVGEQTLAVLDAGGFVRWGAGATVLGPSNGTRILGVGLSLVTVSSLAAWILTPVGAAPLLLAASLQAGFAWRLRARVREVLAAVDTPARELAFLTELLAPIETAVFESADLRRLQSALRGREAAASERIAALRRLVDLLDARRNQLFAPFAALMLWSTQLAFAIENWKREYGTALETWVEALGEFEALLSLAGYAFERPEDVFPEILESGGLIFEARGLGHPLLGENAVRNDVRFGQDPRLLVVSGSNMSGKSTLLRAVGVNTLLALAGAPVCAHGLRLTPVELAASVHVQDSLLAGHSRFYAEVRRLRRVYELATRGSGAPVLYLLDEMLHGTNAEERRLGAERLVRALLETPAAGLVTTHDLALTQLADELEPRARNAHFVDEMGSGGLQFDYRLRPGPATTGNALALMRSEGLPV